MVSQSHITSASDRFHVSALQRACIMLYMLPYLNRVSYEIYGALVRHWNLVFLFRHKGRIQEKDKC